MLRRREKSLSLASMEFRLGPWAGLPIIWGLDGTGIARCTSRSCCGEVRRLGENSARCVLLSAVRAGILCRGDRGDLGDLGGMGIGKASNTRLGDETRLDSKVLLWAVLTSSPIKKGSSLLTPFMRLGPCARGGDMCRLDASTQRVRPGRLGLCRSGFAHPISAPLWRADWSAQRFDDKDLLGDLM